MYAEILILAILRSKPQHGYEIKKNVDRVLGGSVTMNNKVLYPSLKRFEEMGAVLRAVERQEGKPDRHIYQLTDRGTELLLAMLSDFTPELAGNVAEFLVRVAFFDMLEPEICLQILTNRREAVSRSLAHLQEMGKLTSPGHAPLYAADVLAFQEQQARQELEWLQKLAQKVQAEQER